MANVKDSMGRTIEYVRISLTEACNFLCPYCRTEEITPESQQNLVTPEEWLIILEAFHRLGVKAVRFTGGEPLLYPHLEELIRKVSQEGWFEDLSMTTNGSLLAPRAKALAKAGLQRVNISLDSVTEAVFNDRVGRKGQLSAVLAGVESALEVGFSSVKINTVLMEPMVDAEVEELLRYVEDWLVTWRFIEYMPFQGQMFNPPTFHEWKEQLERVIGAPLRLVNEHRGYGPATYYALPSGREIGFIFPMSHSYCGECNRIRLTSDGVIRLCLLRDDEVDVVQQVRNGLQGEALAQYIQEVLQLRKEQHDGEQMETLQRHMWRIGG